MIPIIPFYQKLDKYEVSIVLFDSCNLKCKFCFEPNKSRSIDIDYIKKIPQLLIDKIETLDMDDIKTFNVMLWGGEVFHDGVSDDVFTLYTNLQNTIDLYFEKEFPKINLTYNWLSNGVFIKSDRVVRFLKNNPKNILGFSFDPIWRFSSDKQLQIMKNNTILFKKIGMLDRISITLTKPNIDSYCNNISPLQWFADLGLTIDVNYYVPGSNWQLFYPNDDDLFNFFKIAIDNNLRSIKFLDYIYQASNKLKANKHCDCNHCPQLTKGQWTVDCAKRSSDLPSYLFYNNIDIDESNCNEIKATIGMKKRGCLFCEWKPFCPQLCWITASFEYFDSTKECFIQRTIQYIKEHHKND